MFLVISLSACCLPGQDSIKSQANAHFAYNEAAHVPSSSALMLPFRFNIGWFAYATG